MTFCLHPQTEFCFENSEQIQRKYISFILMNLLIDNELMQPGLFNLCSRLNYLIGKQTKLSGFAGGAGMEP